MPVQTQPTWMICKDHAVLAKYDALFFITRLRQTMTPGFKYFYSLLPLAMRSLQDWNTCKHDQETAVTYPHCPHFHVWEKPDNAGLPSPEVTGNDLSRDRKEVRSYPGQPIVSAGLPMSAPDTIACPGRYQRIPMVTGPGRFFYVDNSIIRHILQTHVRVRSVIYWLAAILNNNAKANL